MGCCAYMFVVCGVRWCVCVCVVGGAVCVFVVRSMV